MFRALVLNISLNSLIDPLLWKDKATNEVDFYLSVLFLET